MNYLESYNDRFFTLNEKIRELEMKLSIAQAECLRLRRDRDGYKDQWILFRSEVAQSLARFAEQLSGESIPF